jgi:hypothetical protein
MTNSTLLLLDPTNDDGETALELLDHTDQHVIALVLLSGPAARSLRDFARSEDIDMATAGWQYLEQVADRLQLAPSRLLAMTAVGPSAATELADIAAANPVHRVLLPSSVQRYEPGLAELLAGCVHAPVLVAQQYVGAA